MPLTPGERCRSLADSQFPGALLCVLALGGASGAQDVVLNEALSHNARTAVDEEGDASDWLEIANASSGPVSLAGWALSDDPQLASRWPLPPFELPAGGKLLVWCSGKDRYLPPRDVVEAPGARVPFRASLVGPDATWRYLAGRPDDPAPPASWKEADFDDSAWSQGKLPLGHGEDGLETSVPPATVVALLRCRFELPAGPPEGLALRLRVDDGFVAYLNGQEVASAALPPGEPVTFDSRATRSVEAREKRFFDLSAARGLLAPGANTLAIAVVNVTPSSADLLLEAELGAVEPVLHASFKLASEGERLSLLGPDGHVRDALDLPPLDVDRAIGRLPDGVGPFSHLYFPSPAVRNSGPAQASPIPAALGFQPPGGLHADAVSVVVSAGVAAPVDLRYTLDGARPGPDDSLLSGPLSITGDRALRVAGFLEGRELFFGAAQSYFVGPRELSLPRMSISLAPADFTAIRADAAGEGRESEREAYLEIFAADGELLAATGTGMRLHGASSRFSSAKKSFRLYFRGTYGAGRLRAPLFADADEFDSLILRGRTVSAPPSRRALIEDQLLRTLHAWLEAPAPRGGWYHVFVDMEPLGLYNVTERVDEDYLEIRTGEEGWTIIKGGEAAAGSEASWRELADLARQAASGDAESLAEIEASVDLVDFSRFVIVNLWLGNQDLGVNWYAYRPEDESAPWRFLAWDGDLTGLLSPDDSFRQMVLTAPGDLLRVLLRDPAFQETFLTELRQATLGPLSSTAVRLEIDRLARLLEPDMPEEVAINGGSLAEWQAALDALRAYASGRDDAVYAAAARAESFTIPVPLSVEPRQAVPGARVIVRGPRLGPATEAYVGGVRAVPARWLAPGEIEITIPDQVSLPRYPALRTSDPGAGGYTASGLLEVVSNGAGFVRGDGDGDGRLSVTDAVIAIQGAVGPGPAGTDCLASLDMDATGEVDLTDPIALLNYLFRRGLPPPAPFPQCGHDPAPAPLPCDRRCAE